MDVVGRDAELRRLHDRVEQLGQGRGGVVWVGGEPGIGKSRLLAATVELAAGLGLTTFVAVGDELSTPFPLWLLAEALGIRSGDDPVRTAIADLLAGRGRRVDAVRAAGEQMVALVERTSATAPVLLALDDAQWADDASLELWHQLARVADQAPLLLIAAGRPQPDHPLADRTRAEPEPDRPLPNRTRPEPDRPLADRTHPEPESEPQPEPEPDRPLLDRIRRWPAAERLELGPLPDAAVDQLAATILGAPAGPVLRETLAGAGGNPLFLVELLDGLVRHGQVTMSGARAEVQGGIGGPALTSLRDVIGGRLGFLSPAARAALGAAAVLGPRFARSEFALMSARTAAELDTIVDDAIRVGVLVEAEGQLAFRHALVHRVLYDELPTAVRTGLHGHAARAFADAGADWLRVAQHLLAAPGSIDGRMLDWLERVPRAALTAQPSVAAQLLRQAIAVAPTRDPRRARFTAYLTVALLGVRRLEELVAVAGEALPGVTEPGPTGEIAWSLARAYQLMPGHSVEGIAVIDRVLATTDPGDPWRGRLRAQRALLLAAIGRVDEAVEETGRAEAEWERQHDLPTIGWALLGRIVTSGPDAAMALVDRGLSVLTADDPDTLDLRMLFLGNRLIALNNVRRYVELDQAITTTLAAAEELGSARLTEIQRVAGMHYFQHGDWDQALLYADLIDPVTPYLSLGRHGLAARIHAHTDNRAAAAEHVAAVAHIPYASEVDFIIAAKDLILARATLAEADGDLDEAVRLLSVWLDPRIDASEHARFVRGGNLAYLIRVALERGDLDLAKTAYDRVAVVEGPVGDELTPALKELCRGMLDGDPVPLRAAVTAFDRDDMSFFAGFAAEELTVRLAARGDLAEARVAFDQAIGFYDQVGAEVDRRRIHARARSAGLRPGPRTPHRRASTGWDALTAAERTVAGLVGEGLANPEIARRLAVSRRTVESHVAHIMRKLPVARRVDIARAAAHHDPRP